MSTYLTQPSHERQEAAQAAVRPRRLPRIVASPTPPPAREARRGNPPQQRILVAVVKAQPGAIRVGVGEVAAIIVSRAVGDGSTESVPSRGLEYPRQLPVPHEKSAGRNRKPKGETGS